MRPWIKILLFHHMPEIAGGLLIGAATGWYLWLV